MRAEELSLVPGGATSVVYGARNALLCVTCGAPIAARTGIFPLPRARPGRGTGPLSVLARGDVWRRARAGNARRLLGRAFASRRVTPEDGQPPSGDEAKDGVQTHCPKRRRDEARALETLEYDLPMGSRRKSVGLQGYRSTAKRCCTSSSSPSSLMYLLLLCFSWRSSAARNDTVLRRRAYSARTWARVDQRQSTFAGRVASRTDATSVPHGDRTRDSARDLRRAAAGLVDHLARGLGFGDIGARFADDSVARMREHDWPGNVRELRNVIAAACAFAPPAGAINPPDPPKTPWDLSEHDRVMLDEQRRYQWVDWRRVDLTVEGLLVLRIMGRGARS
jgi:hypothetical protein